MEYAAASLLQWPTTLLFLYPIVVSASAKQDNWGEAHEWIGRVFYCLFTVCYILSLWLTLYDIYKKRKARKLKAKRNPVLPETTRGELGAQNKTRIPKVAGKDGTSRFYNPDDASDSDDVPVARTAAPANTRSTAARN